VYKRDDVAAQVAMFNYTFATFGAPTPCGALLNWVGFAERAAVAPAGNPPPEAMTPAAISASLTATPSVGKGLDSNLNKSDIKWMVAEAFAAGLPALPSSLVLVVLLGCRVDGADVPDGWEVLAWFCSFATKVPSRKQAGNNRVPNAPRALSAN